MKVDFILKLSQNVPFLYVSWLMFTAESLIKKHSVHPAGSDSLFTYTTGNKTMNDSEIIIDTPGLMKKEPEASGKTDTTKAKVLFMLQNYPN